MEKIFQTDRPSVEIRKKSKQVTNTLNNQEQGIWTAMKKKHTAKANGT